MSVRPFDSGSQYADWQERNCEGCKKFDAAKFKGRCDIDGAVGAAYFGEGSVSDEIAVRMGYTGPNIGAYSWACPEREGK